MSLSIIGTPQAAATSSVTLPTHAIGDIIVIGAYNSQTTTTPTKPAPGGTVPAWSDIDNNTGANTCAMRTVQFVATATNHTSGTWTNTTSMAAIVLRGQAVSPIAGHGESGGSAGTSTAPAVTMTITDGTSMLLHFHGHNAPGTWPAAPAGYTRQAAATESIGTTGGIALNTKDTTTSDGSIAQSTQFGTSRGFRGATVEILVAGAGTATGLFFTMF